MAEPDKSKKAEPTEKKILVIDDDEQVRQMINAALQAEGFQVQTLRDGRNVLPKALEFKPNLVITDLMMPGGGGYEVLRTLQGDSSMRTVPVVMMTGAVKDDSTKEMMKQEPNLIEYLEKPIRPQILIGKVHKILNTLSRDEKMAQQRSQTSEDFDPNMRGMGGIF